MSGILDSKNRILDTIITLEGRRQLANSKMIIEYVTFTDATTYYAADVENGVDDATKRLYLESCHLPQDQITFEADDSGKLEPFRGINEISASLINGQVIKSSISYSKDSTTNYTLTGSIREQTILSGSAFFSTSERILASSIDNFKKIRIIGNKDLVFETETEDFVINNKNIEFSISDNKPIVDKGSHTINVDTTESLFQDQRLSNVINFKYLPPLNKNSSSKIGNYSSWSKTTKLNINNLMAELETVKTKGYAKEITFDPTSNNNSLVAQFFELKNNSMSKLEVIDFGMHSYNGTIKHVFFAGKILKDSYDCNTFIHIFTLVFG